MCKSEEFMKTIGRLYSIFFKFGCTPTRWNRTLVHLLVKDPSDPIAPKTRPISLSDICRRVFERVLLDRYSKFQTCHAYQHGFKKRSGCATQIMVSHELSLQRFKFNCFLDIKAAYDRVVHYKLQELLLARGWSKRYMSLIFSLMMDQVESILVVNGGLGLGIKVLLI